MIQLRVPFELRNPFLGIFNEYCKRLKWKFSLIYKKEDDLISNINRSDFIVAMDIFGEKLSSISFANLLESNLPLHKNIIFLIGGDKGLPPDVVKSANFKMSFGNNTWPHQLCAVMFIEQLYRAETIISRHPYHK